MKNKKTLFTIITVAATLALVLIFCEVKLKDKFFIERCNCETCKNK